MKKITVIPNREKDPGLYYTAQIKKRLEELGCAVSLDEIAGASAVIVIGGDGSILRAAGKASAAGIPILGVNLGRLGYMTEIEMNELSYIDRLVSGDYNVEERMMLSVEVTVCAKAGAKAVYKATALNDAVVSNGAVSRMVDIELRCGGKKVGRYRADGLICSTPTGSTAYSLSAGGPVIDPRIECICVTPVCPHSLKVRPMLFEAGAVLEIKDNAGDEDELYLTVDGSLNRRLAAGETVKVTRSAIVTRLIRLKDSGFFDILNEKMSD